MKEFLQPILDLVYKLSDKYGTKFLVACGGIYGLVYLATQKMIDGTYAGIGVVIVAVTYFVFRKQQETEQLEKEEDKPK